MANKYVRSTDGSGADDGSTWALAKASLSATGASAGDTIFVSQSHAETSASSLTLAFPGTQTSPNKVICGNDAAEPPTAQATTGSVSTTGSSSLVVTGCAFIDGVKFIAGSGMNYLSLQLNNQASAGFQEYQNCVFRLGDTHPMSFIQVGANDGGYSRLTRIKNCAWKLSDSGQSINLCGDVFINGGSFESGTSTPSSGLFRVGQTSKHANVLIENFDFSNLGSAVTLFMDGGNSKHGKAVVRNCKLPSGWSGSLVANLGGWTGMRFEMWNCDSGATNYKLKISDYPGNIDSETTIVRAGGASDGTTTYSWKMAANTYCNDSGGYLVSPDISAWNDTTGSAVTVTVDIVHDSLTALTDGEVWIDVEYAGASGSPLGSNASDRKSGSLAAAANQTTSTAAWTTTGLTNPNKQKLSVTVTPQQKGWLIGRVYLAKASKTIYVDPKLQVS